MEIIGEKINLHHTLYEEVSVSTDKRINVAIVGLGFGAEFIPIYQRHPNANVYAICRRTKSELDKIGDAFGIKKRYTDYNELIQDPRDRRCPHQHADSGPRATGHRRAQGGEACCLYSAHGNHH